MALGDTAAGRVERFLDAHPDGPLVVCVGSASAAVLNWYRTNRSNQGRSDAHLKVWAACDDAGVPQAFLVGSANLTVAGLHENVELMALADASDHAYLRSTVQELLTKS